MFVVKRGRVPVRFVHFFEKLRPRKTFTNIILTYPLRPKNGFPPPKMCRRIPKKKWQETFRGQSAAIFLCVFLWFGLNMGIGWVEYGVWVGYVLGGKKGMYQGYRYQERGEKWG